MANHVDLLVKSFMEDFSEVMESRSKEACVSFIETYYALRAYHYKEIDSEEMDGIEDLARRVGEQLPFTDKEYYDLIIDTLVDMAREKDAERREDISARFQALHYFLYHVLHKAVVELR